MDILQEEINFGNNDEYNLKKRIDSLILMKNFPEYNKLEKLSSKIDVLQQFLRIHEKWSSQQIFDKINKINRESDKDICSYIDLHGQHTYYAIQILEFKI